MSADDLSATLAEERAILAAAADAADQRRWRIAATIYGTLKANAALAALDAALKLPDDWERETERLDTLAQSTADPPSRAAISMRAQAFEECARKLREAITSALTGTPQPSEDETP